LEKSDPLLCLFCHRRHPTLNLALMVDIRQSIVKEIFKGHEQPVWSSNRAFQVDRRPIQKLTKFQPAIAREIGCMTVERGKATEDGRSKS